MDTPPIPLPRTHGCFVCGVSNPLGLGLSLHTDLKQVQARWRFRREHAGFLDTVHGGLLSTVLDELMVWGCGQETRQLSYCAEMTVRFLRPVAPETEVVGTGWMTENRRGRILLAAAEIRDAAGELVGAATGKYMPMKGELPEQMLADFLDGRSPWESLPGGAATP